MDKVVDYMDIMKGDMAKTIVRYGTSNAPLFSLGKEERRLIEVLRSYKWGEATVVLKNGVPVMLRGLREDVKLSDA